MPSRAASLSTSSSSPYARARPILTAAVSNHGSVQNWSAAAAAAVWTSLHEFNSDDWVAVPTERVLRNLIAWVRKEVNGADDGSRMRWAGWLEEVSTRVQRGGGEGESEEEVTRVPRAGGGEEREEVVTRAPRAGGKEERENAVVTHTRKTRQKKQQQAIPESDDEDTANTSPVPLTTTRRRNQPRKAKNHSTPSVHLLDDGDEEHIITAPSTRSRLKARATPSPNHELAALLADLNAQMSDGQEKEFNTTITDTLMPDAPIGTTTSTPGPTNGVVVVDEEPVDLIDLTTPPSSWSPPPGQFASSSLVCDEPTAPAATKSSNPKKSKPKQQHHPTLSPAPTPPSPSQTTLPTPPPSSPSPCSSSSNPSPITQIKISIPTLLTHLTHAAESYTTSSSLSQSLTHLLCARAMLLRAGVRIPAHPLPGTLRRQMTWKKDEEGMDGPPAAMWMLEPLWKGVRLLQRQGRDGVGEGVAGVERDREVDWEAVAGWVGEAMDVVLVGWPWMEEGLGGREWEEL